MKSLMSNIRIATIADSERINSLSLHLGYGSSPQDEADKRLRSLLKSTNDRLLVFEESNLILGWIHIFKAHRVASAMFYEIGGLVVDPKARNQGIGRKLVEFVVEQSAAENIGLRVRCNSLRKETHKFYEKLGFSSTKEQYVFKASL